MSKRIIYIYYDTNNKIFMIRSTKRVVCSYNSRLNLNINNYRLFKIYIYLLYEGVALSFNSQSQTEEQSFEY
jgi:hypothetical protein